MCLGTGEAVQDFDVFLKEHGLSFLFQTAEGFPSSLLAGCFLSTVTLLVELVLGQFFSWVVCCASGLYVMLYLGQVKYIEC